MARAEFVEQLKSVVGEVEDLGDGKIAFTYIIFTFHPPSPSGETHTRLLSDMASLLLFMWFCDFYPSAISFAINPGYGQFLLQSLMLAVSRMPGTK